MADFVEPTSLPEAQVRLRKLFEDAALIEAQLGNKRRSDDDGHPLTPSEYNAWRQRAKYAWTLKRAEYKFVKRWLADKEEDLHQRKRQQNRDLHARGDLLAEAFGLLKAMLAAGYRPTTEEQETIDAIRLELSLRQSAGGEARDELAL